MAKSGIYRCKESFAYIGKDKVTQVCVAGQLVPSDHPAYKGNKDAFEEVEEFVEQMTAAPGEQRAVARPSKSEKK